MSAWAETSVNRRDNSYSPREGELCSGCGTPFRQGERVFRLTDRQDDEWFCEGCTRNRRGGVAPALERAADEGMGC